MSATPKNVFSAVSVWVEPEWWREAANGRAEGVRKWWKWKEMREMIGRADKVAAEVGCMAAGAKWVQTLRIDSVWLPDKGRKVVANIWLNIHAAFYLKLTSS